eukprot:CAMPEP_0194744222 /NCGR_PEP_ID=MMETSP0296-20130528/100739_1 /TAXON_ID=39354 /ORGANISM="Heterosigma akashiwo, Strain CCMP2393" /LENGTH=381 /DNA_ID=CAMNT_0039656335 /DNA_START=1392 /DNA_END=2538 /DNA_ORIENTATION=+
MQYGDYLTQIKLNDEFVEFGALDLGYLGAERWAREYPAAARAAREVRAEEVNETADYLERTLGAVLRYHPGEDTVPIIISQDGNDAKVVGVVDAFRAQFAAKHPRVRFHHIHRPQEGNLRGGGRQDGYQKLAQHFGWAFRRLWEDPALTPRAARVIVLEEDLEVAPDFFELFGALAPLLDTDPTLLAASAWNDNGQRAHVAEPAALLRSDFFPGLGWMATAAVLRDELLPKWPKGYWDDWLREPAQRRGRHTLRPEICRTFHFGIKGTSNMQYGDYLTQIKLNDEFVEFGALDLGYLGAERWAREYPAAARAAREVRAEEVKRNQISKGPVRVKFNGIQDFARKAKMLGIMDNEKAGVPRTAYKNIVEFWHNGIKVYVSDI